MGPAPDVRPRLRRDLAAARRHLRHDPKWQLQATYGRYVSRFNDNVASTRERCRRRSMHRDDLHGPDVVRWQTYDDIEAALRNDANWDVRQRHHRYAPADHASWPTISTLRTPRDMNLTVKWALPRNTGTVTITYTHRKYENLLDDFVGGRARPRSRIPREAARASTSTPRSGTTRRRRAGLRRGHGDVGLPPERELEPRRELHVRVHEGRTTRERA